MSELCSRVALGMKKPLRLQCRRGPLLLYLSDPAKKRVDALKLTLHQVRPLKALLPLSREEPLLTRRNPGS